MKHTHIFTVIAGLSLGIALTMGTSILPLAQVGHGGNQGNGGPVIGTAQWNNGQLITTGILSSGQSGCPGEQACFEMDECTGYFATGANGYIIPRQQCTMPSGEQGLCGFCYIHGKKYRPLSVTTTSAVVEGIVPDAPAHSSVIMNLYKGWNGLNPPVQTLQATLDDEKKFTFNISGLQPATEYVFLDVRSNVPGYAIEGFNGDIPNFFTPYCEKSPLTCKPNEIVQCAYDGVWRGSYPIRSGPFSSLAAPRCDAGGNTVCSNATGVIQECTNGIVNQG